VDNWPTAKATPVARPVAEKELFPPTVTVVKPVVLEKLCAEVSFVPVVTNRDSKPEIVGVAAFVIAPA